MPNKAIYNAAPSIEDDAYAVLPRAAPSLLAALAADLTHYINGISMRLIAGTLSITRGIRMRR
jgi:hypothetical protein